MDTVCALLRLRWVARSTPRVGNFASANKATQAGIKTRFTSAADLMLALTHGYVQNN